MRMEAHFPARCVALAVLRLLRRATGLPASRTREEMASMSCSALDANRWLLDHRTDESDLLLGAAGLGDLRRKAMRTTAFKVLFSKARKSGIPHKEKTSG